MPLEEAFASGTQRLPKHVLYCGHANDPDGEHEQIFIYAATYAARKCLEIILDEDDFVMETSQYLRSSSGIHVRCTELQAIIDYEYSLRESAWDLPYPHNAYARNFRKKLSYPQPDTTEKKRRNKGGATKARKTPGMLTIGEIADQLGVHPRDARQVLRKSKTPKPSAGWCWKPEDAEQVKSLLRRILKPDASQS